ncbi:asparagine synthetase B [Thalassotalea insulae]|uniref:asparagine synthase (glutamine-hydrolyzing) n=1 Tax=Thalassotalea insulae TaxID=2056778 RepID=A0ABQ6GY75_9GAMM|nr:asparagine synthase-related protein [Thalassotalea insulae]GLX79547.1 asparagine synthetase B [Thalassotalea insulae]
MSDGFILITTKFPKTADSESYKKVTVQQNEYLLQANNCHVISDERSFLILEGYIHNYELSDIYQAFRSNDKTIFSQLDGCFCGVYIDENQVIAFNDRLGAKTVFWQKQQDGLCFTSRAALMPIFETKLCAKGAYESIHFRWLSGEQTLLESVNKLPAKHFAYFSHSAHLSSEQYWQLPVPQKSAKAPFSKKLNETKVALSNYLETISKKHKTAAIFLSGGVDSSLLAALSKEVFEKCYLITPVFPDDHNPELDTAKQFAHQLGLEHILVDIKPQAIQDNLQDLLTLIREPIRNYSSLTLMELMKNVPADADIVLYGEAADTLFGANNIHKTTKDTFRAKICKLIPHWLINSVTKYHTNYGKIAKHYKELSNIDIIFASSQINYDKKALTLVESIATELSPPIDNWEWYPQAQQKKPNIKYLKQIQLVNAPLAKHFSEAQAIAEIYDKKLAIPFMTNDIFKISQSLRYNEFFNGVTKPILRELACQYFPRELIYQRKYGFPVPFISWLQGALKELVEELHNEQELFNGKLLADCTIENHYELYWLLINWQHINHSFKQRQLSSHTN